MAEMMLSMFSKWSGGLLLFCMLAPIRVGVDRGPGGSNRAGPPIAARAPPPRPSTKDSAAKRESALASPRFLFGELVEASAQRHPQDVGASEGHPGLRSSVGQRLRFI